MNSELQNDLLVGLAYLEGRLTHSNTLIDSIESMYSSREFFDLMLATVIAVSKLARVNDYHSLSLCDEGDIMVASKILNISPESHYIAVPYLNSVSTDNYDLRQTIRRNVSEDELTESLLFLSVVLLYQISRESLNEYNHAVILHKARVALTSL